MVGNLKDMVSHDAAHIKFFYTLTFGIASDFIVSISRSLIILW